MFGGHATSCVRHAFADLTLRWEEVCFSFGHYWLYEYWLTTLGSSLCRQSTHRVFALDRRIHVSPFVSIWCRASWLSVSTTFECRADIHSVRASGYCRPVSPFGGGLLRFATVLDRCILVYHVNCVRHQEDCTSLSASHCTALTLLLRHAVFGFHKPLVHPLGALLPWQTGWPNVTCVACSGFDPVGVQNFSFAFMTLIFS